VADNLGKEVAVATVPPLRELDLESWATVFLAGISPVPASLDLTSGQITAYGAALADYSAKLATARDPATANKGATAAKNAAKAHLLDLSRSYLRIIEGVPGLSEQQRADLGMNPARNPHPPRRPAPTTRPVGLVDAGGFLRLMDEATPTLKRRPAGYAGAYLFTAILPAGAPAPTGPNAGTTFWKLVTETTVQVPIPPGSFAKVLYIFAQWTNARGDAGPTSALISVMINVGSMAA
jgi:hypothetical protein